MDFGCDLNHITHFLAFDYGFVFTRLCLNVLLGSMVE